MRVTPEERGTEDTPTLNSDWAELYSTRLTFLLVVHCTGPHPTASEGGACVGIHVNNKEKLTNKIVNAYKVSYKSLSEQSKTNGCHQYFQDNNLLSVFPSLITTFASLSNDICINTASPFYHY